MNGHQPSNRLKYAVILALGFSVAQFAGAVGLGPIIGVSSHIGQPLSATIRIDGLSKEQAQRASISLASAEEYRTRGIQRLPSHDQLRFKIVPAGSGYRIQVTSKSGIREPFINFLLTVTSEGQKVTREYALFLNPDPTGNIAPSVAVPAEDNLASEPVAAKPAAKTVAAVAQAAPVLPAVSAPPAQDNGFIGQARPSQGQHGIVPASAEAEGWGAVSPGAQRVVLSAQSPANAPREQAAAQASYSGATYGPVKSGETLYSIAAATKPASMTVNEMMVAIKRANPRAFSSSSMNSLMAGVTLTIPGGSGVASAPAASNVADTAAVAQETPAEKPRNRRNRRQQQQAAATAAAPTQAAAETPAGNETPAADMTASTESPATATEMPQDGLPQTAPGSETSSAEPMVAQTETQVTTQAAAENAEAPSGMDTGLSLEGVDSIADSSEASSAMTEMPPVENTSPDMAADSGNAGAQASEQSAAETAATEVAAVAQEAQNSPAQTAAVSQTASAPAATPVTAPASGSDELLPFGLKIWHLAAAAGVLLIGLLLAILMKARGRKREIDDIEDMSPAEIDRMVAELEKDESLQQSFRDDLDNLDDLSYETLSQEKQHMDSSEEDILKARLAELAELEALENEAEDDFDTLAQKAQDLPAFEFGGGHAPQRADADSADSFAYEDDADVFEISPAEDGAAARSAEQADSFVSDWDFSEEEPTVQTSAHEEDVEDFFAVEESWTRPASMVSETVEIVESAPAATAKESESFDFSLDDKPSKPAPQLRIVPVENPAPAAAPAEETVSPEKVEAMEINLDLATSFIATGNAQRARVWLDEVMLEGSAAQKALAAQLLKKIEAQK